MFSRKDFCAANPQATLNDYNQTGINLCCFRKAYVCNITKSHNQIRKTNITLLF